MGGSVESRFGDACEICSLSDGGFSTTLDVVVTMPRGEERDLGLLGARKRPRVKMVLVAAGTGAFISHLIMNAMS